MMTEIARISEFDRDLKKLMKKYPSLNEDMEVFIKALSCIRQNNIPGIVRIANIGQEYERYPVYKVRSFRCRSLTGSGSKSGMRVVFYDDVSADKIILIQIYHKSATENHDRARILNFLDSIQG